MTTKTETPPDKKIVPPEVEEGAGSPGAEPTSSTIPSAAKSREAAAFLREVAEGRRAFELTKGNHPIVVSEYGYHAATHLASVLGTSRKEALTLAVCYYIRALTSPYVTSQNDLAMLTRGVQFVVQDLAQEVAEFSALAVSIANQEAIAGPAV